MFRLAGLVIVLTMVTHDSNADSNAVCVGAENTTLTFNLSGTDPSTAGGINWFYYGLYGNLSVTVGLVIGGGFIPGGTYGSRVRRQDGTNVNLILSQPSSSDVGMYGCRITFTSSSTFLENTSLKLTDGATPGNLALSLTYNSNENALQCGIPGLTSLGDAMLAISGDDGKIQANGTSLPLRFEFTQKASDKNFTCFLTGPGAGCSNVTSNGTVTVRAPTPTPGGPFPSCWRCIILLVVLALLCCAFLVCFSVFVWKKWNRNKRHLISPLFGVLIGLIVLVIIFDIVVIVVCLNEKCTGLQTASIIFIIVGFICLAVFLIFILVNCCSQSVCYSCVNSIEEVMDDCILQPIGSDLKQFVVVELTDEKRTCVVRKTWLKALKDKTSGNVNYYARCPPKDKETEALRSETPSETWTQHPAKILKSTDNWKEALEYASNPNHSCNDSGDNPNKTDAGDVNKRSGNGNETTHHLLSPKQRLPPLDQSMDAGNEQPDSERKKKKKKSKKDRPESQEPRPLPMPQTERKPSIDVPVSMSGSNTSPLPLRSNFTPGQPASEQSESAMTPVGSSSLKKK